MRSLGDQLRPEVKARDLCSRLRSELTLLNTGRNGPRTEEFINMKYLYGRVSTLPESSSQPMVPQS